MDLDFRRTLNLVFVSLRSDPNNSGFVSLGHDIDNWEKLKKNF